MKRAMAAATALLAAGTISGCAGTTVVHTTSARAELRSIHAGSGTTAAPVQPTAPSSAAAARPSATGSPVTTDADCPFLDTAFVQDTVGQHIGRVTTTSTVPSSCAYYRYDGGFIAKVDRSTYPTAAQAAAAGRAKTGAQANPVTDIGDGGTVAIIDSGAVLAVTQGAVLIVVQINQQSSLECRELAARALPG
ncbi:MAG TPA: DUF2020 domain-containing protein [Mycobacteriales bacterium]|nr:DUF2020 domain-containing protein [Mycobacteriales bacterium]